MIISTKKKTPRVAGRASFFRIWHVNVSAAILFVRSP
jgi:hypothetical protein